MKHGKLFAQIVYYFFTIMIGVLLALFLPYILMSDGEYLNIMETSLKKGKYDEAMLLVGGYFERTPVYHTTFDEGGGIVLFNAATLVYNEKTDEEDESKKVDESELHKSYAGFVYGVKDRYDITSQTLNMSQILVTDNAGVQHPFDILDGDINGDKKNDTNVTYYTNGFFFLDIDQATYGSISKLTLIDKDGNVFAERTLDLSFQEQFFNDVDAFITEYNRDYKSEALSVLNDELLAKNSDYSISSLGIAKSKADTKAAIIVVAYFIGVYIVGDFLVGPRYILRFIKWFLFKVCKIKVKSKAPEQGTGFFGNDYYCQATIELDVTDVDDFEESVQIRYTDKNGEEITFILLKENDYISTQRIKAGNYVNMWIDIDKTIYGTQGLPETLEVWGYKKVFKIKILKREEKAL